MVNITTKFILVYLDSILMFFNLTKMPYDTLVEDTLKMYSISFIPMSISTTLIFIMKELKELSNQELLLSFQMIIFSLYPFIVSPHWYI